MYFSCVLSEIHLHFPYLENARLKVVPALIVRTAVSDCLTLLVLVLFGIEYEQFALVYRPVCVNRLLHFIPKVCYGFDYDLFASIIIMWKKL